jgi:hypothetical protein
LVGGAKAARGLKKKKAKRRREGKGSYPVRSGKIFRTALQEVLKYLPRFVSLTSKGKRPSVLDRRLRPQITAIRCSFVGQKTGLEFQRG